MTRDALGADRNLLFGIVALQMDFIDRDRLVAAMHAWVLDKSRPIGQILEDLGALAPSRRAVLEALVDEHVRRHGDDPARSLATLSSAVPAVEALAPVRDPDLQASLGHLAFATPTPGRSTEPDPSATRSADGGPTTWPSRFRIVRTHAEGGLGTVSIAIDSELNRQVALKQIRDRHADEPASRARFLLEAEITGGLEPPGIVPVWTSGGRSSPTTGPPPTPDPGSARP